VAFSPAPPEGGTGGRWLATGSGDKTARLWSWRVEDLINLACRTAGRNLSREEWGRYFGDEPYRKTCEQWPVHPSVISSLLDQAQSLAREGDVEGAVARFKEALALDPSLTLDPRLAAQVEWGTGLVASGRYTEAMAALDAALLISPTLDITATLTADAWNSVCRWGSLSGAAAEVLPACERAVALAPEDGGTRDSRGLARALTGDTQGAIEDFAFAVQWAEEGNEDESFIASRQAWIADLKAGKDPATIFTPAVLEELR
jgi:tetratricopeptide (TPR) repeat protein